MSLLVTIYRDRKKTIIQQLCEIKLLASDLTVNNTQLRDMISQSFTMVGISESWLRKLLSEYLKSTKLTRKDYPDLQQPRDHQPLQQQQQELAELPSSSSSSTRHPGLEQQPSDDEVQKTRVTTYDNNNVAVRRRYKNEQVSLEGKVIMIRHLKKIEQLQEEIRYLHNVLAAQQQPEETFTALGCLQLQNNGCANQDS
jgi:hypothetical protein